MSENHTAKDILIDLRNKEKYEKFIKESIRNHIKEKFGVTLPLDNDRNYNIGKLNEAFSCLVDMLAETLSKEIIDLE